MILSEVWVVSYYCTLKNCCDTFTGTLAMNSILYCWCLWMVRNAWFLLYSYAYFCSLCWKVKILAFSTCQLGLWTIFECLAYRRLKNIFLDFVMPYHHPFYVIHASVEICIAKLMLHSGSICVKWFLVVHWSFGKIHPVVNHQLSGDQFHEWPC